MNNPVDDSTHTGNHSLLDDLMHSLNLDSHQHGNPQPSEVVDLSHLHLGADLNVYDADGHKIGYVTPSGRAYTPDDKLFATGGTASWAAATLVFNTCTQS